MSHLDHQEEMDKNDVKQQEELDRQDEALDSPDEDAAKLPWGFGLLGADMPWGR